MIRCAGLLLIFLGSVTSWALTPQQVVTSSLNHYPKVIQALQKVEESRQKVRGARGAFDAKVKGQIDSRLKGYYGGDAYKGTIEKGLPYLNLNLYGGRRQSFSGFPSYEGKSVTLDDGEMFAGFSMSLLRDSLIDKNRYNLQLLQQDALQEKLRLQQTKINVQTMALQAYWGWLIKGQELAVYKDILKLSLDRAGQIKKRIRAGDLARIYKSENDQYIRKREAQVVQSQLDFQRASYYLSLFYRDNQGQPRSLNQTQLPSLKSKKLTKESDSQKVINLALQNSLALQVLKSKESQAQLDIRMGTNEVLPKLDVSVEWSEDQTATSSPVNENENRVMIQLEVPIEYNKGLGKRRAGKNKKRRVQSESQLTREQIIVEAKSLVMKLNSLADIYSLTQDQVRLARKLAVAEKRKFTQGDSDLILVNIREENLAEAEVKNLQTLLKYYFVDAEVKQLKLEFF